MTTINTGLTRMLGIKVPIIGAPMFLVSYEELVAAVSNAGGLGALPLPNYRTLEDLKKGIKKIKALTDKPFGVNIHTSGKFPWEEQLDLCLEQGVKFFITSLGDPVSIIKGVHKYGGKVFVDVVNLKQAIRAKEKGVDGLIAIAKGAGGHGGNFPIMVLVPYLIEKIGLPVIAAGGISNGRQMAAAMALGAMGVVTGTRLIATKEAMAVPGYKQAVIESVPEDIVCTNKITGNNASWIAKSIEKVEKSPELGSKKWFDIWSAGVSVAQAETIEPAGDIIREMAQEYCKVIQKLNTSFA